MFFYYRRRDNRRGTRSPFVASEAVIDETVSLSISDKRHLYRNFLNTWLVILRTHEFENCLAFYSSGFRQTGPEQDKTCQLITDGSTQEAVLIGEDCTPAVIIFQSTEYGLAICV